MVEWPTQEPSVMCAVLCALGELASRDARTYRNLVPSFVSILKQVPILQECKVNTC